MTDNDYVATAAAEKRLREVLAAEPAFTQELADAIADSLLAGAKIEYKARAKQVTITLDLPDKATATKPAPETATEDFGPNHPGANSECPPLEAQPEPQGPRIVPFAPKDVEPDYEDRHFD